MSDYIENRIKRLEERTTVLEHADNGTAEALAKMWKEIEKLRCEVRGTEYINPLTGKTENPTDQPTEEFVRVVKCGECACYDEENLYCDNLLGLPHLGKPVEPTDYCSRGEKR